MRTSTGVRIAVVTAREAQGLDEDEPLLLAALERAGADAQVCVWDDAGVDWAAFDAAVVRSTWDYAPRREEFLAWAVATAQRTVLRNPEPVLAWNTDKTYLLQLAARGVPIVPTTWVRPGAEVDLPAGEVVVKPTVSAGSRDTARYPEASQAAARAHVRALTMSGRTAMVQPYLPAVDSQGETSLLFIGGAFSHAVTKAALLVPDTAPTDDLFATESIAATTASEEQHDVAAAVLAALPFAAGDLTYARVDLVPGAGGEPLLLELELAEPSLFLLHHPPAADRLADAVLRGVRS